MKFLLMLFFLSISSFNVYAQDKSEELFPEKCLGIWEGTMYIYRYGKVVDSVQLKFTAAKTDIVGRYTWKKEYLSPKMPMTKDYDLVVDPKAEHRFILDEGEGIELVQYCVGNKLYSMFKVKDTYLTSSTELRGHQIIFEVTSGKEVEETNGVQNISYAFVQRAILYRVED